MSYALEELQTTSGTDEDTLIGEWAPSTSVEPMEEIVRRSSRPPPSASLHTSDTDPGAEP